ncbi:hypothetical protein GJAV_G00065830 [Gymnothorax javanicus]|nr:hypothetical protein GJAV_G00065830 [Gymnothorax javanicus]
MKFNLIVYTPVSKPVIALIAQNDSARSSVVSAGPEKDCSALCSVENGRERRSVFRMQIQEKHEVTYYLEYCHLCVWH